MSFNTQLFSELPRTKVNFTIKIHRRYSEIQKGFIRATDGEWLRASTRQYFSIALDANCAHCGDMTDQVTCREQPDVQAATEVSGTEPHV